MASNVSLMGNNYSVDQGAAYIHLMTSGYYLEMFVMVLSYICGIVMIIRGFAMYKAFGQNVNMASRPGELAGPLVYIVIGTMLFYFPSFFQVGLYTFFGTTTPTDLSYTGSDTSKNWAQLYDLINRYCRLIGVISFFRGLILVSHAGEQGSQPGSITRGMIHLVAGVLIYNIGATVSIFMYTFGIVKV